MKLESIGPDIWVANGTEIKFLGLLLGTRTTIVRLVDGSVWIHSPIAFDTELAREIERIGPIRYLVAPNVYHHFFLREWQERYPDAQLVGPHGLPVKRPDLSFSLVLEELKHDPWQDEIDRVVSRVAVRSTSSIFPPRLTNSDTHRFDRKSPPR